MIAFTWYGTASVALSCDGGRVLFDPFLPLKGGETNTVIEDFDGYTDILVTHGHLDHIASLPRIYRKYPWIRIYCTDAPYQALLKKGIPAASLTKLRYGDTFTLNGFDVTVHHAKHAVLPKLSRAQLKRIFLNRRALNLPWILRQLPVCRENDETVLYELRAEGKTVLVMGSMNLRDDREYPADCDYLVLPYNGWEDNFPPAVRVIERLRPAKVLLDHYDDTFPPVSGPVDLRPILEKYGEKVNALRANEY